MRWTADQRAGIEARGGNLLLAAAAGSGKTTVLVARVLSLIEEGANVDQMLIVTFSRAAASDMKQKLTDKLTERAQTDARMRRQLERVERANVSTLHAFCIDVLRAHFEAALVDPAFRVLEQAQSRQLESRAMNATLESACEQFPQRLAALDYGRGVKKLAAMIASLYHFAQERPDPDAWLENACHTQPAGDANVWADALLEAARGAVGECWGLLTYARTLCGAPLGPAPYLPALDDDIEALDAIGVLEYEPMRGSLCAYRPTRISAVRVKDDDPDAEARIALREQVKALRDEVKARISKAAALLPGLDAARADMLENQTALDVLHALTLDFGARFDALKADRSALTFGDLEHAALRALTDPHVAQAVQARFAHVFVDEYQDVSDLQEAVIARVARADNLFMVGDVKQSIYRFRQAEPTLFIDKYHRYAQGEGGRLIALTENFRSRASILAFVNRVFERAMSGPDAEIAYDDAARLQPGAAFEGDDPPIEVHIAQPGPTSDDEAAQPELSKAEREGALVAERIRALLGTSIIDPALNRERPVRPRDIVVIARTRAGLTACEGILRAAGIPAYADVDGGYFDALEVRIMLSLMQVVENRRRDYPLLGALRSPVVGLTSSELARVRAACPDGSFRDAMLNYLPLNDELAKQLRAFESQLERWRMLSRALPLTEFVDLLLRETGFYAYAGGMPGGAARQGNLDLLCAYASQFESAQAGGLTGFLAYVQEVGQTGGDVGAAHMLGEHDDVVRLMTAHKSKGLEFPIVFALQLGRSLSARQAGDELLSHRLLGVGLNHHDPLLGTKRETIARRAIRVVREREALEEEKRILYVLLTRAKQRLILVGSEASPDKAQLRWAAAARAPVRPLSFLDMIMPALPGPDDALKVTTQWHEGIEAQTQAERGDNPAPIAPHEIERARAALTWRYPFADEAFLPVKLTVSGLARTLEGAYEAPPMSRRPRFLSGERATAAERGTLTHSALSAFNLSALRRLEGAALRAALTDELKRLEARGVLTEPIDPAPIAAFFERDMGRRLLNAKEVHREWPFNLRMTVREALDMDSDAELMVQGVVDCCFIEDGAWVLLDYKTDRLPDEAALKQRHRAQLTLYRHALERITGIEVKQTLLCLLRAGREIEM